MKRAVVTVGGVEAWHPSMAAARRAGKALRAKGVMAFVFSEDFYRTHIAPVAAQ